GRLSTAAKAFEDELAAWSKRTAPLAAEKLARVNEAIQSTERTWLLEDGLPRRPWYRHQLYAPGTLTGYAAKTLPGVREAIEAKQWDEANQQSKRLADVLRSLTTQILEAARLLHQASE